MIKLNLLNQLNQLNLYICTKIKKIIAINAYKIDHIISEPTLVSYFVLNIVLNTRAANNIPNIISTQLHTKLVLLIIYI